MFINLKLIIKHMPISNKKLSIKQNAYDGRWHAFLYEGIITEETAKELQEQEGYPIAGYGFHNYLCVSNWTSWRCYSSCD
jgi:hypothetical protein